LELFWVTGFVYQISSSLSPPAASKHCRNRSPITLPPHPPATCPGSRRFSGPQSCTQYKHESRNGIFTALQPCEGTSKLEGEYKCYGWTDKTSL